MSDAEPAPVPRTPRPPLADAETLVEMGVLPPQNQPPPDPPVEPPLEEQEQANTEALDAALREAGISQPENADAIAAISKLDPELVEAITQWVSGKPADQSKE